MDQGQKCNTLERKTRTKRAISKCFNGDIRFQPSLPDRLTNLGPCLLFVYLGMGLFFRGIGLVRQADEGFLGGIFLIFFSLLLVIGSITIATLKLREIGTILIRHESREISFSPSDMVAIRRLGEIKRSKKDNIPFDAVASVVIRSQTASYPHVSSLYLSLKQQPDSEILLTHNIAFSSAKHIADEISTIIGCNLSSVSPLLESDTSLTAPEDQTPAKSFSTILGNKILRGSATLLMVIGLTGFLGAFFIALLGKDRFLATELPLGSPSGIAIDLQGRIYVGSRSYMRIQRYTADGKFDHAWHVRGGKGEWHMFMDDEDRLVLIAGSHFFYRLNKNDQLLEPYEPIITTRPMVPLRQGMSHQAMGPGNTVYHLNSFPIGVSRTKHNGHQHFIFKQSVFMTMFTGPFPAFIIFALGLIISLVVNRRFRR